MTTDTRVSTFIAEAKRRLGFNSEDSDELLSLELDELVHDLCEHRAFNYTAEEIAKALDLPLDEVHEQADAGELWDRIYDFVGEEAASINNQGVEAQVQFLLKAERDDISVTEILDSLDIREAELAPPIS